MKNKNRLITGDKKKRKIGKGSSKIHQSLNGTVVAYSSSRVPQSLTLQGGNHHTPIGTTLTSS